MTSPFLAYSLSFSISIITYLLGWSNLYPPLSGSLALFLSITILMCAAIHFWLTKRSLVTYRPINSKHLNPVGTTIFIYILWTLEFFYEGGIPFLKILFHVPYNYRNFGIPSLHVFVVTFSSFFTIYLFHLYLSSRVKLILVLFIINLLAAILIYSRAMLYFNLAGSLFVYLLSQKKIPLRRIALVVALIVPLSFAFGIFGSLRVSREAHEPYNNENFMATGEASQSFRDSIIPKEFFWTYIYISSPLANLQLNIDKNSSAQIFPKSILWTGIYEILPDFITKRIHVMRDTKPPKEFRINYSFNVSTVYSRAYSYSGWGGLILIATFIMFFPWIYSKLIGKTSDFLITGWAILCTMYLFLSYDNTFRFTGLSLQLAYPVLFFLTLERIDFKKILLSRK